MKVYACLKRQVFESGPYMASPVQEEHIEPIRRWRNAQLSVLRQASAISFDQQIEYFSRHVWPAMECSHPATILVSLFKNRELIGYGGLVHLAWEHQRAELSFLLAPERVLDPKTYAEDFSAFIELMKNMAFIDLGLHKIFTETYDIRPHHISILEASGFCREGVLRDHVRIDGRPVNSLFHGCVNQSVK